MLRCEGKVRLLVKAKAASCLTFVSPVAPSQSDEFSFLFFRAPSTVWCPLALLQPSLMCAAAIRCPSEEQQEDSVWCIAGSSIIHTEISVRVWWMFLDVSYRL